MLRKMKTAKAICLGGILTSITVLFQAAPVFLPAVGMALSPFSTLPILLAAVLEIPLGVLTLFSSALLLLAISPQEAVILLLTTGPLGIAIGSLLLRKGGKLTVLLSAGILFLGMLLMMYAVGIPTFGDFTESFSNIACILVYLVFSIVYVCFWTVGSKRFLKHLLRTRIFQSFFE